MRWSLFGLLFLNVVLVLFLLSVKTATEEVEPPIIETQAVAFPASLVLTNELEEQPTAVVPAGTSEVKSLPMVDEDSVVESIVAYEEVDLLKNPLDASSESLPQEDYEPSGRSRICINLSNLEKDADMAAVIDMLDDADISPEIYIDKSAYHWVFMKPEDVAGQARTVISNMRERKLDAHLLKDGKYKGGISAGVFVSKENADLYAARLQRMGFNVSLDERGRKKYRVVIDRDDVNKFNREVHDQMRRRFNFVKIEEEPC